MSLTDLPNWGSKAVVWLPSFSWWASDTRMATYSWEPAERGRVGETVSDKKKIDLCTNFYLCWKNKCVTAFSFFHFFTTGSTSVCSFGCCSGGRVYLVAVVGIPGWEMLPIKLLPPQLGSQSTRLQPTEGCLESSLSCDYTHWYC